MYRLLFPGFGFKIKKQMDFIEFWIICAFVCLNLAVTHIVTDSSTDKRFNGNRSSRPEVFCKKGVLRNFTKFTGKHLCQRLFFNKVAGLRTTASAIPVSEVKKEALRLKCDKGDHKSLGKSDKADT